MGYSNYSLSSRKFRSVSMDYDSAPINKTFTQQDERKAHETMLPKNALLRECRDSVAHPLSVPIIMGLDVTGSMLKIPHEMIKSGLPTLMGNLIQRGISDPALMFLAIGDHESDRFPLQVAQFESGDAELDMWLTRTYLEGNGGGNAGESYILAWYFASRHTVTDAWEKRGQKGFLFTIGDEPYLPSLPASAIREIMGDTVDVQGNMTMEGLLKEVQEKYNVFHFHVNHNGRSVPSKWKSILDQNCIEVFDHTKIPMMIVDIVDSHTRKDTTSTSNPSNSTSSPEEEIL